MIDGIIGPADNAHRFAPAAPEAEYVFGACCPGWHTAANHERALDDWIAFVREQGIERVCCLLPGRQLDRYGGNVARYEAAFGPENVRHAPIPDHHLAEESTLSTDVLPFLDAAVAANEPVVVHCLAGIGRTGQVLAAWLVHHYDYHPERAVETVRQMGRAPGDAVDAGNATEQELYDLLATFR
ncbi:MAG: dual specificity protein phosphatase family protein [Haloarculaceae archaeon]